MLDPTQPGRSFVKWGLVTRDKSQPKFVSFQGKLVVGDTRKEIRDLNHLAFQDKHKVTKIRLTVDIEK